MSFFQLPRRIFSLGNLLLLFSLLVSIGFASNSATAQQFRKEVILDGLEQPTGITVDLYGNLYFTELPTPGVSGANGGSNRVNSYNSRRGRIRVITEGEPEPTNLTVSSFGNLYWTCRSAGVILSSARFGRRDPRVVFSELEQPVGIDTAPFANVLFFTEVPEPGEFGGANRVNVSFKFFGTQFTFPISTGEPEPSDVAVGLDGTVYWTCKTAGVILRRGVDGSISPVLENLESPIGLDIDWFGRLYFTEVPTPGVSGDNGGRNRVVRYNPRTEQMLVISEGEPEPQDVTVSVTGRTIYWTCRTAGVIIRASREK